MLENSTTRCMDDARCLNFSSTDVLGWVTLTVVGSPVLGRVASNTLSLDPRDASSNPGSL